MQLRLLKDRPSALYYADEHNYERKNEQQMNESTQGVGADHSQRPENQQDYRNCPEHMKPS
jgi:hypothetical protein